MPKQSGNTSRPPSSTTLIWLILRRFDTGD
jgi:hypothetical protein